jgi:2-polyprenyl-3-methyl-5-hydroxy-6-metoxy-1,4-benzoquinol methylase
MSSAEQAFWLDHLGRADRFSRWVAAEIAPFIGRSILEVGCGTGTFTRLMAPAAERLLAIDIDAGFVRAARKAVAAFPAAKVERADVTKSALPQDFDTVVMLDVLEHIEDDVAMLKRLRTCLAPGGRIVVKVPAIPSLHGPMDAAIGHYRRYDPETLRAVLAAAGFEMIGCRPFNMLAILGWWLNGKVLGRTKPPGEQVRLFNLLVPALRLVERLIGPPTGLSLIAASRRV